MRHFNAGSRLAACLSAFLGALLLLSSMGVHAQALSLLDGRVVEGDTGTSTLLFEARLSAPASGRVSFNVEFSDGSATAGSDYSAAPLIGVLSLPVGATSLMVAVPVKADGAVEPSEYFNARLTGVLGATVADANAKGLILDDDAKLLVSAAFDPALSGVSSGRAIPRSAMSGDGRYVAFASDAPDLVANGPGTGLANIYVRDTRTGVTTLASRGLGNASADGSSSHPSLSNDGRYLVFESTAGNLVAADFNATSDVFLRDLASGTTTRISVALGGGDGDAASASPVISADGRHVAFHSLASNLVAGDSNGQNDVFVRDLQAGTTQLVSVKAPGSGVSLYGSESPTISADGRYIAFMGDALVVEDTWQYLDIYRRDMLLGVTQRISVAADGGNPDNGSRAPVISADGRYVVFQSSSTNLGAAWKLAVPQLYRRDIQAGVTLLVSADASGFNPLDQPAEEPSLSADGRYVVFRSSARATPEDTNTLPDIFVRDLLAGSTTLVSKKWTGGSSDAEAGTGVLSADGRFVAFEHSSGEMLPGDGNQASDLFQVELAQDAALPVLSIADTTSVESDVDKQVNLVVSLSAPASQAVSFDLASADGSAVAGSDYSALVLANLSIPAGQSSLSVPLTIRGDDAFETDETFTLLIGNVRGARVVDPQSLHTIVNDDTAPVVPSLSIADVTAAEGNVGTKSMSFTVSLSAAPSWPVVFDIATSDSSARAGSDYVAWALTGQQIPAGQTSKSFAVTINGDVATEINETFNVNVTNVGAATVADGTATGTITNDDPGPTLSVNDVVVAEGNSGSKQAIFTVSLSAAQPGPVSFDIATADGSAKAGSDYVAKATLGAVIAAGATSTTFAVTVNGDTEGENDETFTVDLSNTLGAGVTDGQGMGTISNDDASSLSIGDATVVEGHAGTRSAVFTVQLSNVASGPVTFDVATADGTAAAGSDYVALVLASQTIPAGQTSKTVSVTVNGDTTFEPNETFLVNLSKVVGAPLGDGSATGTITNDDLSTNPAISIADARVLEGDTGKAELGFRVSLSAPASSNVGFKLSTRDHLASAPGDYTPLGGFAATIPAGQTSVVVKVAVRGDTTIEANETLFATIHDLSGNAVSGDMEAVGVILNDDGAMLVSAPANPLDRVADETSGGARMTPDGRYVVFHSRANDMGQSLDRLQYDVYLRDTVAGTTALVSSNVNGGRGSWESSEPSISDDGRYVVFVSYASDLVPNDTNGFADVYRRDMKTGAIELVTVAADGGPASDATFQALISGDGRQVAFITAAVNLVPEWRGGIFMRDMQTQQTRWIGQPFNPAWQPSSPAWLDAISRDGRYVLFSAHGGNLADGDSVCIPDPTYYEDQWLRRWPCMTAYWRDTLTGESQVLHKDSNGEVVFPCWNRGASISADGQWVGFMSDCFSPNHTVDVFIRDIRQQQTWIASIGPGGQRANAPAYGGYLSPDATHIAFHSAASNLVPGDTNGVVDTFVRRIGAFTNVRIAPTLDGAEPNAGTNANALSNGGRRIAMLAAASNFMPGDDNGMMDIFVTDHPGESASDADLVSIVPSVGGLSPAFAPAASAYTLSVVANAIRFTPTARDPGARITVNGVAVASGYPSGSIPLAYGLNHVVVQVTAADASLTRTTTLDVTRVDAATPVLGISDASLAEGNTGTRQLGLTVSLSKPAATDVSFTASTIDDIAVAGADYVATRLAAQVIPAGSTSKTVFVPILGDTEFEPDEGFHVDLAAVTGAAVGDGRAVATVLNDDVGHGPILDIVDAFMVEGQHPNRMEFKVRLSTPASTPVTFDVATSDGTASELLRDYAETHAFGITIPAGETTAQFNATVYGDNLVEGNETFFARVANVRGAVPGDLKATGTIIDASTPTFTIHDLSIVEGNSGSKLAVVTASIPAPSLLPVSFDVDVQSRMAAQGTDFTIPAPLVNLQIPVGATSTTLAFEILGDTVPEGDEFFELWIQNLTGAVATRTISTVTLLEDDAPRLPVLAIGSVRVVEGNNGHPLAAFPVTLSEPSPNPVTFSLTTQDGSATSPADYTAKSLTGLVIPPGSTVRWVRVSVNGDHEIEPVETFEVSISDVVGATVSQDRGLAEIVNDDSDGWETGLSVGDVSIAEGDSGTKTVNVNVSMGVPRNTPTYFDITTYDGSAKAGSDYQAMALAHQQIPAGSTSADFAITINGDTLKEPDETITVALSNNTGSFLADPEAVVTLLDEEGGGADVTPELRIADTDVAEGNEGTRTANLVVSLSAASIAAVRFDLELTDLTATAGSDYTAVVVTGAVIPAGETRIAIPVPVRGDTLLEPNETFKAVVSNVSGASVVDDTAIVTIMNDEVGNLPSLSLADVSVVEGTLGYSWISVTVSLSSPAPADVEFDIATVDGVAKEGSDFGFLNLPAQVIPAGQSSRSFAIGILGDEIAEADETFSVRVSDVAGALVADESATVTILNDDPPGVGPSLSIGDAKVTEGNSGYKWMIFTVTSSAPMASTVDFPVIVRNGTARWGEDYVEEFIWLVTLKAGETSHPFGVLVIGDTQFEEDEVLTAELDPFFLQGQLNVTPGHRTVGVGTIINDDTDMPTPELSVSDVSIDEGDAGTRVATFKITLSEAAPWPVSFDIATANGTAMPGVDFVSASAIGATIPAGATSTSFAVTVVGDADDERNETFTVNVDKVAGATVAKGQGLGTIVNDDAVVVSIAGTSVTEGNSGESTATFVISLSRPLPTPVSFDLYTRDGTALAGSDYVARSQVGRIIDAGRTRTVFEVNVKGDTTAEANETFEAVLSNVYGATVGNATAVATIANDDSSFLPIGAIQGTGLVSPLQGREVATTGVVTAVTASGFFLQSEAGHDDGDPSSSEGLFVASRDPRLYPGNRVSLRGRVEEVKIGARYDQLSVTQVSASQVTLLPGDAGLPAPAAVEPADLGADAPLAALERFEGMRVALAELGVVGPSGGALDTGTGATRGDGRFVGVLGQVARPFREPGLHVLDPARRQAGPQVPLFDGNPERLRVDTLGQRGTTALSVDVGDSVRGLVGVLSYREGAYELLTDASARLSVQSGAKPRPVSLRNPGQATISTFHVGGLRDHRSGAQASTDPAAYALRLAKVANAVCAYTRSPDILAISGAEGPEVMADLAGALTAGDGNLLFPGSCAEPSKYRAVATPAALGGSGGFLVRQDEARPAVPRIEVLAVSEIDREQRFVHPDGATEALHAITPSVLQVRINEASGASMQISVMAVGLSPLDGELSVPGDHGWRTRGDYLRARRSAQAASLARAIQARQRSTPGEKLVVLGNLESPEFADGHGDLLGILSGRPVPAGQVLRAVPSPVDPPLTNLVLSLPRSERYTVNRDGNAEALDHVLVSRALGAAVYNARVEIARINADFGQDNAADAAVPLRVSAHDPVVLYLDLRPPP